MTTTLKLIWGIVEMGRALQALRTDPHWKRNAAAFVAAFLPLLVLLMQAVPGN